MLIRFQQFLEYPTKIWEMSRRHNPQGFAMACQSFLRTDDETLDLAFSLPLKQDAWRGRTEAEAVCWLMGDIAQLEIDGVLSHATAHSLDVERKHQVDKRNEFRRALSLSAASRNTILQQYRRDRAEHVDRVIAARARAKKDIYMNAWALAVSEQPDQLPRARGHLRWQQTVDDGEQRRIVHEGDMSSLREHLAANRDRLEAEARLIRQRAKEELDVASAVGEIPYSNKEWLSWLADHDALFAEQLRTATKQRNIYREKITPLSGSMASVQRIAPVPATAQSTWEAKLIQEKSGYFTLVNTAAQRLRVSIFAAAVGARVWGLILDSDASRVLKWSYTSLLVEKTGPLYDIVRQRLRTINDEGESDDEVMVYRLRVGSARIVGEVVEIGVRGASAVSLRAGASGLRGALGVADDDVELKQHGALDVSMSASSASSSSAYEVQSDVETDAEQLCDDSASADSSGDDQALGLAHRAPRGAYVVEEYRNEYSWITNNPNHKDVKLVIAPYWARESELGTPVRGRKSLSKAVTPAHFNETKDKPLLSYIVLRSWLVWRLQQGKWHERKTSRQKFLARTVCQLAKEVAALGVDGGGAGCKAADDKIAAWAPHVLGRR